MKRVVIWIVLCMMILSSCSTTKSEKIVVMMSSLENPFFDEIASYTLLMAEMNGLDLVVLDSKNNVEEELKQYKTQNDIGILILNPVDSKESSEIVKDANSREIPVITIDRNVDSGDVITHITSDNYEGGVMAAKFLESLYEEDAKVILLEGIQGAPVNDLRVEGFIDYLSSKSIFIDKTFVGHFERKLAREALRTCETLSDDYIVFATNDEMALGAIDVMLEKEIYMVVIGFDGTSSAVNAVGTGFLAGTVAQQPEMFAKHCIDTVKKISADEEVSSEILIGLKMIAIKEN